MKLKSWQKFIKQHLEGYRKDTKKIFNAFDLEVKRRKLKNTNEINMLWRKKYKRSFDKIDKKYDKEYTKLWNIYHKRRK